MQKLTYAETLRETKQKLLQVVSDVEHLEPEELEVVLLDATALLHMTTSWLYREEIMAACRDLEVADVSFEFEAYSMMKPTYR